MSEEIKPEALPKPVKRLTPFYPGHPKWGGRKKGDSHPLKRTQLAREIAAELGADPIRYMLTLLVSEALPVAVTNPDTGEAVLGADGKPLKKWVPISPEMKLSAAKDVAKYLHPTLAATVVTGADGGPIAIAALDMNKLLSDPAALDAAQTLSLRLSGVVIDAVTEQITEDDSEPE